MNEKEVFRQNIINWLQEAEEKADELWKIVLFASTYKQPEFRLKSKRYKKITPANRQEQ